MTKDMLLYAKWGHTSFMYSHTYDFWANSERNFSPCSNCSVYMPWIFRWLIGHWHQHHVHSYTLMLGITSANYLEVPRRFPHIINLSFMQHCLWPWVASHLYHMLFLYELYVGSRLSGWKRIPFHYTLRSTQFATLITYLYNWHYRIVQLHHRHQKFVWFIRLTLTKMPTAYESPAAVGLIIIYHP